MPSFGPQIPAHLLQRRASRSPSSSPPPSQVGPQIPAELLSHSTKGGDTQNDKDDADYTPALPPDMLPSRGASASSLASGARRGPVVGPTMPLSISRPSNAIGLENDDADDDGSEDEIGPKPPPAGVSHAEEDDPVREFMEREERRRKAEAEPPKKLQREEWMLVPPTSSGLLSGLDPTRLKPRQFRATAAPMAPSTANNLWTETPAERQQRLADEVSGKRRRAANADAAEDDAEEAERRLRQRRDERIRREVEEQTRQLRGPTLLSQHASRMKASAAPKEDDDEQPPAIWDHGRDMSLGGRLMDDRERGKIIREARSLGDRFGKGKFLGS